MQAQFPLAALHDLEVQNTAATQPHLCSALTVLAGGTQTYRNRSSAKKSVVDRISPDAERER